MIKRTLKVRRVFVKKTESLKDFIDKKGNEQPSDPPNRRSPGSELITREVTQSLLSNESITAALTDTEYLSPKDPYTVKREKFNNLVSETVGSDKFLQEISDKAGTPHKEESKEEFVNRVVSEAREILYRKLKIKDK